MYLPFNEIDLNARIWIFQANRNITDNEVSTITETLKSSLEVWDTHGHSLTGSVKIFENRFIIIAVDERVQLPSGCSIDKLSQWIREIGHQLNIDFFDRSLVFMDQDEQLSTIPVSEIKNAVANEVISRYTTVFDNQVQTKAQWMTKWKVTAASTWLKRYFSDPVLS